MKLISGFKQPGKETFIIKLQGIDTREHAEQLKKHKILVKEEPIGDGTARKITKTKNGVTMEYYE